MVAGRAGKLSTSLIQSGSGLTMVEWIAMTFCIDFHGPQTMKPIDHDDLKCPNNYRRDCQINVEQTASQRMSTNDHLDFK